MRKHYFAIGLLCLLCFSCICRGAQLWLQVSSVQKTFDVSDVNKSNVSLLIKSIKGNPLYRLQCHSAGYTGDPDFDYSGDFECRLSSVDQLDAYSTLLTEDANQSRDWESRGRFFAAELRGPCARIPEFGNMRSFALRGMMLKLQIIDPKFQPNGKLRSLKLKVTVRADPAARRPIAEIVPFPKDIPPLCKRERYLENYFIDPRTFAKGSQLR